MTAIPIAVFFIVNLLASLAASLTSINPIWSCSSVTMSVWLAYSITSSLVCGYLYSFASFIDELLGVYSFFEASTRDTASRFQFYDLSYPGGHPRMWNLLKNTSCRYIDVVHDKLECATYSKQRDKFSAECYHQSAHLLEESKTFCASGFKSSKEYCCCRFERRMPLSLFRRMFWMRPPVFSLYETVCATLAIRSLTCIVSNSLTEDQYGVVQKDLRPIITMLTRLSIAIDAYVRSVQTFKQGFDSNVRSLDETLTDSLREIYSVSENIYLRWIFTLSNRSISGSLRSSVNSIRAC
uniref:Uncharacterized protein n=1 Tax=Ditylenchus dipsaci TaxID=166011 RepID=A0A915CSA6_9BILA